MQPRSEDAPLTRWTIGKNPVLPYHMQAVSSLLLKRELHTSDEPYIATNFFGLRVAVQQVVHTPLDGLQCLLQLSHLHG